MEHRKNLAGMGLGAFVGILTSWYIAPAALPFGCLAGAILGYGHDIVLLAIGQFIRDPRAAFAEPIGTMRRSLTISRPHPVDLAGGVIFVAFAIVMSVVGSGVFQLWNATPEGVGFFGNYALLGMTVAISVTAGRSFVWLVDRYAESPDIDVRVQWRHFYAEWDLWNRGALSYFAAKVLEITRFVAAFGLTSSAVIGWYAALILPFICVWSVVCILAAMLNGIYQAAKSSGYWFCFAVALGTAAPIAWLMYPYFGNTAILWLTATTAAVIAGFAGEMLLVLLRWAFALSERLDQFAATDFPKHGAAFVELCHASSRHLYQFMFPDDGFVWGTIAPQPR